MTPTKSGGYKVTGSSDEHAERFSSKLHRIGLHVLATGSAILSGVSAATTWGGLITIMSPMAAGFTAAGIQAVVIGGYAVFAHARNLRARIFGLAAALVAEVPSGLFTLVYFFALLNPKVALRENAVIAADSFHEKQAALQVFGEKVRSRELKELDETGKMAMAEVRVLSADEATRRREAEHLGEANRQLQQQLATAETGQQDTIRAQIRRNQQIIRALGTDAKAIRLQIATSKAEVDQIDSHRAVAEAYQPDFLNIHDGDWAGLRAQYIKLAAAYSRLSDSDSAGLVLPAAPSEPTHNINGEALRGQQEPFYEVLARVGKHWDGVIWWSIFLTAAIELSSFLAMWAVRSVSRDWPARVYEYGVWMRRMLRAITSAGGIFPFLGKGALKFLFGQPVRAGHAVVSQFEDLIEGTLLAMKAELRQASAPHALATLIETKLEDLASELIYRNYAAVADLDEKVIDALDECLGVIRAAGLPADRQRQLEHLVHGQADRIRSMYRTGRNEARTEAGSDSPEAEEINKEDTGRESAH